MNSRSVPAYLWWLLANLAAVLLWSGTGPKERGTWWLEVAPVLIGIPILLATYRRFPLTPLAYVLVWIHAGILMIGEKCADMTRKAHGL